jgi:hypothetical protein
MQVRRGVFFARARLIARRCVGARRLLDGRTDKMKPRPETLKNHFGVEELLRAPT